MLKPLQLHSISYSKMFYNNSPNYCYGTYYYCYGKSDRTGLCFKIFYKYATSFPNIILENVK